jgi:hypothetical protein
MEFTAKQTVETLKLILKTQVNLQSTHDLPSGIANVTPGANDTSVTPGNGLVFAKE